MFKLTLCGLNNELITAWEEYCGDLDFVEVFQGSILEVDCDAVVSPANSFGFMDGGIDALYMKRFGPDLQMTVRRQIYEHHAGELIVGNADIVETGASYIPFLIIAPTMRVPMILKDTVHPYLAARAAFLLLLKGSFISGNFQGEKVSDHVKTVAFPGLGTGVGRVSPFICAKQVRKAIDHTFFGPCKMPESWAEASEEHQLLYSDKAADLQY
ncbi:Appr-1-p processing domain protein [Desulfatibacillum aliphaticivorans]|uniref:Appr-1-p processing domain protein n=1 Tax=Desulfatibacillum aliphaticivorans TaxID=218208 RepID=B8FJW7_DESAL|nr:macro domain-containing protein [Desulfatibacillum aliphaticivorans]ACL02395.1 Appr-1-p processing domain protein [Desulfatibacillum aliphaticivorans]